MSDHSYEPDFIFLKNAKYTFFVTGVCLSFAGFTCFLLLTDKHVNPALYFILPISLGLVMAYLPPDLLSLVHYILRFCDFPISSVVSIIVVRFTFLISRYALKYFHSNTQTKRGKLIPDRRNPTYRFIISFISVISLTIALILIGYGLDPFLLSTGHGFAFSELLFCFLFTIVCDNGIISDACLTALYASLYLSPILSLSSGHFTVLLRLIFVISSLISFIFSTSVDDINEIFPKLNKKQTTLSMALTLISYVFLSPDAFIRPTSIVCNFQAIMIPLFYSAYILREAYYFDIATPYIASSHKRH
ncbi:hypothetical protein M9Y10_013939 [Tritrichomonas musculus]|uniref:Uncharacterized protein n=1 Tax=Tritrichomonas musculus TaxID=1915356 RepID=A0ABR2KY66_9EUKA